MTDLITTPNPAQSAPDSARELPRSPPIPEPRQPVPAPGTRAEFLKALPDPVSDAFDLKGRVYDDRIRFAFGQWDVEASDDADVRAMASLHERAVGEFRAMAQTVASVYADDDPALNSAGRLTLTAGIVGERIQSLTASAERELDRVQARIAGEEAQLNATYRAAEPAQAVLHDAIRRHVKENGLDRLALARGETDTDTLQAIAGGPAFLSGLDQEQHARVCKLLAERTQPERVQIIAQLRKAKFRAVQAIAALDRKAGKFIDFKRARALAAKARKHD